MSTAQAGDPTTGQLGTRRDQDGMLEKTPEGHMALYEYLGEDEAKISKTFVSG